MTGNLSRVTMETTNLLAPHLLRLHSLITVIHHNIALTVCAVYVNNSIFGVQYQLSYQKNKSTRTK